MEKFLEAVGIVLTLILACLACAARPACARYMYDTHPAGGYVAAADDGAHHDKVFALNKYNTNPNNMKLVNERAVDSYFRILRATPQALSAAGKDRSLPLETRNTVNTEPPSLHNQQNQPAENTAYSSRIDPTNDNYNEKEKALTTGNQYVKRDDEEITKRNGKELTKHSAFDKGTLMANGNKKTNRRPHRAQNVHIMYLSQVRDKTLHKANLISDNARAISRPRADASRPAVVNQPYTTGDHRKRHTIKDKESIITTGHVKDNKEHASNYKCVNEDRFEQAWRRNPPPPARVRGYAAGSEAAPPYALFYRMNHEPELEVEVHEDTSYRRGNYLDLNTGRKHSTTML